MFAHDYLRLALASPDLALGQPASNKSRQIRALRALWGENPDLIVFPPLSLTGLSLGPALLHPQLLAEAEQQLLALAAESRGKYPVILSSLPLYFQGTYYLAAALLRDGALQALVALPLDLGVDSSLHRYLAPFSSQEPPPGALYRLSTGQEVPFLPSSSLLALDDQPHKAFCLSAYTKAGPGRDFPAFLHRARGKLGLVFYLGKEELGLAGRLQAQIHSWSQAATAALAFTSPAYGESSTDGTFSGSRQVAENGEILGVSGLFNRDPLLVDLDLDYLAQASAQKAPQLLGPVGEEGQAGTPFLLRLQRKQTGPASRSKLYRPLPADPFIPVEGAAPAYYAEAFDLLTAGLRRRLDQLPTAKLVLGLSGGLDSCLALLICRRALLAQNRPLSDLVAVSMPGPGSHDRTRNNARDLALSLGASFREIPIHQAVDQHLADLGHPGEVFDATYENAQARERTQILMDLANQLGGLVIGTGDLSELALGWCTYNGDQMSMYNVNSSVPKTLVRALCQYEAEHFARRQAVKLAELIFDIIATPVSPELLPLQENAFSQKTEAILGPYELHDFFLWHLIRRHASPQKILDLALLVFQDRHEPDLIRSSLETFLVRFSQNQFKRSASPDGASLGLISLSPREGFYLPSDLPSDFWSRFLH